MNSLSEESDINLCPHRRAARFRFSLLQNHLGFTLIELLIVVAIIAILAAIAVPNFLEAQTRTKVARVRADFSALATAIEAYAVDWNAFPMNDGVFNIPPVEITTPVAYLTSNLLVDPFSNQKRDPVHGNLARFYTYTEIVNKTTAAQRESMGRKVPIEAIDHPFYNEGAFAKYGAWRIVSNGPDRSYIPSQYKPGSDPHDPFDVMRGTDIPYDSTNGSASMGNLLRTQQNASGPF